MHMLVFGQPERNFFGWLLDRSLHRDSDSALDLANVLQIRIQARLVDRTERLLKMRDLLRDGIQDAGVLLAAEFSFLRVGSVAEQALESHARIHFRGQRLDGRRPRDWIRIRATIT